MEEKFFSRQLMHEPWHNFEKSDVLKHLITDEKVGLKSEEATKRLNDLGPNILEKAKNISWFSLFLNKFKNVLVLILLFASVLSGF